MYYFKPIIFVCALAVGHADCGDKTARQRLEQEPVRNEIMCAKLGQARLAQTALVPGGKEYVKLTCLRVKGEPPPFAAGEIAAAGESQGGQ